MAQCLRQGVLNSLASVWCIGVDGTVSGPGGPQFPGLSGVYWWRVVGVVGVVMGPGGLHFHGLSSVHCCCSWCCCSWRILSCWCIYSSWPPSGTLKVNSGLPTTTRWTNLGEEIVTKNIIISILNFVWFNICTRIKQFDDYNYHHLNILFQPASLQTKAEIWPS